MKQPLRNISLIVIASVVAAVVANAAPIHAADARNYKAGRIIDDSVFTNSNSMSVSQIQAFLDSKMPNCDTNGDQLNNRAWMQANYGINPPYRCVNTFRENPDTGTNNYGTAVDPVGSLSSAELIYKYAKQFNINPQVLIVTLQKENGMITDNFPIPRQFQQAMGFGCPDNVAPGEPACDPAYNSFSNQLYQAARHFRGYINRTPGWTITFNTGWQDVLWSPTLSCGSGPVYIENQATAALYTYTPYQPNNAAKNAQYGLGDGCSAYGNRNFYLYFTDWFGTTIGPDYAWEITGFSYAGGDNSISVGETETLTLKARNIGRNPWYNHGANPIRLATWEPADRISKLFGTSRVATLQESVVNVGEVGTFTFTVTPQQLGTFYESLNLVADNAMYMPWTGFRPTIQVVPAYSWSLQGVTYDSGTGVMEPGTQQLVTVRAKNTGNATWRKDSGPQVKLATWEPNRQSAVGATWPSRTRAAAMNESSVAPGQVATFQFYVTMPPAGGYQYEKMNLVAEGVQWFNNENLTLYLYGTRYAWQPLWHAHSTGTANIPRNTDFTVTLKVKNTGDATWDNSKFPLRLGTSRPLNRGSGLFSPSSWINDTRPVRLLEDRVAPGQEGTFLIPLHTPETPGPRVEYFQPVAEGLIWLNDPGFNIYVNVL